MAGRTQHQAWLMVVLVSGVSLAGYAALRLAGPQHGAPMMGLLGGLVSSTATTVVFSRHAHAHAALARTAMVVIMIASLMVLLRLTVMAAVVAPDVIEPLAKVFAGGLVLGLAVTAFGWRRLEAQGELPMPEVRNPTEIRTALGFGALYAVVLFCSAWLSDVAGAKGMYAVALASGLTARWRTMVAPAGFGVGMPVVAGLGAPAHDGCASSRDTCLPAGCLPATG